MNKQKTLNELKLILFCAAIGAAAGIIFWLFLFLVNKGTWLIWDVLPGSVLPYSWYPLLACTAGGLIIGIFRKFCGDYPEEMMTVFGKLKINKTYPYRKMAIIIIAALLPLIFGSSVGPEAGMVGVVVALCCWAGDNLKFAGSQSAYYSKVGAAVSLSVMFRSPLFGILNVEDGIESDVPGTITGDEEGMKSDISGTVAGKEARMVSNLHSAVAEEEKRMVSDLHGAVAEEEKRMNSDLHSAVAGEKEGIVSNLHCTVAGEETRMVSDLHGTVAGDGIEASQGRQPITKLTKIILYCVATGTGFGFFWLMNTIFGKVSEGFPTFESISLGTWDYILFILYLACGILLGVFFEFTEKLFEKAADVLPPIISEVVAGLVLGGIACLLPVIKFSGEEQMGVLIRDFAQYAPFAMIGIAFLKIIMTNMCIRLGLKGGHFFPLIFAAVCFGYGVALLFFPGDASHATFAAAVVAAGTLGVSMKKPLAVSMLLLLCFPVKTLLWIVPAAAAAAWAGKFIQSVITSKLSSKIKL